MVLENCADIGIGLGIANKELKERLDHDCNLALKKWGNDIQLDLLLEELSGFINAILELKREKNTKGLYEISDETWIAVEEAMIDVLIRIRQLAIMNGYDCVLDDMVDNKLDQLETRLLKS